MTQSLKRCLVGSAVVVCLLGGCAGREHLSPAYGRAYTQAFSAQVTNRDVQIDLKAQFGLDNQEAGIIARSYKARLAPQEQGKTAEEPVVFVAAPSKSAESSALKPSVPNSQYVLNR